MELTVLDRIQLLTYLPKDGNLTDYRILRKLKYELSFSEEEQKALNFRNEEREVIREGKPVMATFTLWNHIPNKDVEIGDRALAIIKEALTALARSPHGVTDENFALFETFEIEGEPPKED